MDDSIKKLQSMIDDSERIVFFGGAGVSTESGIPDFRSANGIYSLKSYIPPEEIVSHGFFTEHPEEFWDFYKKHLLYPDALPNEAHRKLAELEKAGKRVSVVTQNIDGLHQDAGSTEVYELHGSVRKNRCLKCGRRYTLADILSFDGVPRCGCGGIIKPEVVLYGEGLDEYVIDGAIKALTRADMLIVAGTSLAVYPAAGLVRYFRGKHSVLINLTATPLDQNVDLAICAKVGEIMSRIDCCR